MSGHLSDRAEQTQSAPPAEAGAAPASSLTAALLPLVRVAELLACHERTVRRWIRSGRLAAYRLPGGWRVDPADLARFLDRHRTGPRDDDTVDGDVEQSQDDTQIS